jgi:GNAT superfamily N-acetyltransferase
MQVRKIRADEGLRYRDVRLRGLKESPEAFVTTYQGALERPESYWRDRVEEGACGDDRVTLVGDDGTRLQGTAGGLLKEDGYVVEVVAVWVAPEHRGRGLGAELVSAVVDWGNERGASVARLWVNVDNHTAIRLYERLGFQPTDHTQIFGEHGERTRIMMVRSLLSPCRTRSDHL